MNKTLVSVFASLVFCVSGSIFAQSSFAGKWTGELPAGRMGIDAVTLELAVNGIVITGKFTSRIGSRDIVDVKLSGDTLTFSTWIADPHPGGGPDAGRGQAENSNGLVGARHVALTGGGSSQSGASQGPDSWYYSAKVNGNEMIVSRQPQASPAPRAPAGTPAARGAITTFTLKREK